MSGKIFLSLLIALGLLVKVAIHDVAAGEFYKGKTLMGRGRRHDGNRSQPFRGDPL